MVIVLVVKKFSDHPSVEKIRISGSNFQRLDGAIFASCQSVVVFCRLPAESGGGGKGECAPVDACRCMHDDETPPLPSMFNSKYHCAHFIIYFTSLQHRWAIAPQYIEQFRIVIYIFQASAPTIQHDCPTMACRPPGCRSLRTHPVVYIGASRNLFIMSKKDPENGPEHSQFLYLCGNYWFTYPIRGHYTVPHAAQRVLSSVRCCISCSETTVWTAMKQFTRICSGSRTDRETANNQGYFLGLT